MSIFAPQKNCNRPSVAQANSRDLWEQADLRDLAMDV
jgi:hypothetical protein